MKRRAIKSNLEVFIKGTADDTTHTLIVAGDNAYWVKNKSLGSIYPLRYNNVNNNAKYTRKGIKCILDA